MRKWLSIFSLLLAFSPLVPSQPDKAADKKQQLTKPSQPAVIPTDGQNKQSSGQQNQTKPDADPPRWYTPLERPDWWLVIVAALTGGVVGWQSFATAKSAKAAKKNIDLVISQNQPRLAVSFEWNGFVPPSEWALEPDPRLTIAFSISVTNQGRGDAFDVKTFAAVVVKEDREFPLIKSALQIPDFPIFLKAQGEEVKFEVPHGPRFPTVGDIEDIRAETTFMHLFGYIAYTDTFGMGQCHPFRWVWKNFEWAENGQLIDDSGWNPIQRPEDTYDCQRSN